MRSGFDPPTPHLSHHDSCWFPQTQCRDLAVMFLFMAILPIALGAAPSQLSREWVALPQTPEMGGSRHTSIMAIR